LEEDRRENGGIRVIFKKKTNSSDVDTKHQTTVSVEETYYTLLDMT